LEFSSVSSKKSKFNVAKGWKEGGRRTSSNSVEIVEVQERNRKRVFHRTSGVYGKKKIVYKKAR